MRKFTTHIYTKANYLLNRGRMALSNPVSYTHIDVYKRQGLDSKIPLSTEDYKVSDISLEFNVEDGRVEYIFYCDVE